MRQKRSALCLLFLGCLLFLAGCDSGNAASIITPPIPTPISTTLPTPPTPVSSVITTQGSSPITTPPLFTPETKPPTVAVSPQPTLSPTELRTIDVILDIAFVDTLQGWLLGESPNACPSNCAAALLRTTLDGGKTWQDLSAPLIHANWDGNTSQTDAVSRVRFIDRNNGWLYRPGLYATHDGGKSWVKSNVKGQIVAFEPAGTSFWAVQQTCTDSDHCTQSLIASSDGGETWQPAFSQRPTTNLNAQQGQLAIVRSDAKNAWLLPGDANRLLVTHDSGTKWQDLPDPCVSPRNVYSFAVLDVPHIWLICAGNGATDMMPKSLFASSDGGKTWALRAFVGVPNAKSVGEIPLIGFPRELVFTTMNDGFLTLARNIIYNTHDGGRTWKEALDRQRVDADGGQLGLTFVDAAHGWFIDWRNTIYRTTDGGKHWDGVAVT